MTVSELKDAEREGDDWVIHVVDFKMADADGVAKVVESDMIYDMPVTYACKSQPSSDQEKKHFVNSRSNDVTRLSEKMKKVYNIHLTFKYFSGHLIPNSFCICPHFFPH